MLWEEMLTVGSSDHLQRLHIKALQCSECNKRFGTNSDLERHGRKHCRGNNPIKKPVQEWVVDFSKRVTKCIDIASLDKTLFINGIKQYDFVDDTDGR